MVNRIADLGLHSLEKHRQLKQERRRSSRRDEAYAVAFCVVLLAGICLAVGFSAGVAWTGGW